MLQMGQSNRFIAMLLCDSYTVVYFDFIFDLLLYMFDRVVITLIKYGSNPFGVI